ncbi:NADH dehydrogenase [ubiquinone] 1 alpha subcomplex subunit 13 [Schistosoma japonicum]|uniref:NADH dehydrogenase [ubiquinone] 1 alpha subcomplex subunit 13 n=1 Tax=Schistosoma japonicum TaxID=6182 RepID=Q86FC0_SCHJA|nr:similar to NM_132090 CG3446 gene product in Drosophila melanogaster [Schistosoma japonicum]KAH8877650.1 NADH dehydrogenase [ubiquinone] 1 alpha subcomplex subunit 13 [Schistosoma japonicum]KAH8877651.1 NADH dehydrogenase [ubiquinone] 1 alpha subcomplex subunit 13 [Schistosoma japonicum]TNN16420.1 NADH dehydrogenase [ubiquinone] 1 alpha subcomplex subunit 13 [Schistosoma japonicum]CAX69909.1 cell death-regulatory protein GRIM19 [Schistosoma japonicum]
MPDYKQEMPPPGGFPPVDVSRKMPKLYLHGLITLGALYASSFIGFKLAKRVKSKRIKIQRENQECRIALTPFILAEQQRLYLKQLRRNRDYEDNLMKDVAGWETGKWFDYPVYHNPRGLWYDPNRIDFYAHTSLLDKEKRDVIRHSYF